MMDSSNQLDPKKYFKDLNNLIFAPLYKGYNPQYFNATFQFYLMKDSSKENINNYYIFYATIENTKLSLRQGLHKSPDTTISLGCLKDLLSLKNWDWDEAIEKMKDKESFSVEGNRALGKKFHEIFGTNNNQKIRDKIKESTYLGNDCLKCSDTYLTVNDDNNLCLSKEKSFINRYSQDDGEMFQMQDNGCLVSWEGMMPSFGSVFMRANDLVTDINYCIFKKKSDDYRPEYDYYYFNIGSSDKMYLGTQNGVHYQVCAWIENFKESYGLRFNTIAVNLSDIQKSKNGKGYSFNFADLSGLDLSGIDFEGTDFSNANLTGALLTNSNLTNVDLTNACLLETDLTGATLFGTKFINTDVTETIFDQYPRFTNSTENECTSFERTKIKLETIKKRWSYLDLTNAEIVGLTRTTDLSNLQAKYSKLVGIEFCNCNLESANFDFAYMVNLNLERANFNKATFRSTQLHGANFTGALLENATLSHAFLGPNKDMPAANLSSAYMPNANLEGANLDNVDMSYAHFYGVSTKINGTNLENINLSNANLGNLDLRQAQLQGADLTGANLINARLCNAILSANSEGKMVSLAHAQLQGADFTDVRLNETNLDSAAVSIEFNFNNSIIGGIILFSLDTSELRDILNQGKITSKIYETFENNGYSLKHGINVDTNKDITSLTVVEPDKYWCIEMSGSTVPPPLILGYVTFKLCVNGDKIIVYGTRINIQRLKDKKDLEVIPIDLVPTKISEENMNDNTICPNQKKYSENKEEKATWEEMMTAPTLPAPPKCVPSPYAWCPST